MQEDQRRPGTYAWWFKTMTDSQKIELKLEIIKKFEGLHFSLVEMYSIFDELKSDLSKIAVEQELKKLKFRKE